ncbi:MAG: exonuclease domain-containing protein [Alphaproteobacteria bacterium]|nr:exonuclease domain-containing protein [Alphaproteobacteria bacterium]MBF0251952.1 exonuclease domain-containing protein [Alphaproteobacteria bacterium]
MLTSLTHGDVVVFDTEWTSWPGFMESGWKQEGRYLEIIQIGAVRLDAADGFRETDSFQIVIRPERNPTLSEYIIELTGITQEAVDTHGLTFAEGLARFEAFLDRSPTRLLVWGVDHEVIARNCRLHAIAFPRRFEDTLNMHRGFVDMGLIGHECYSSDLPARFGLACAEPAHDALGDSRALASVLRHLRARGDL